MKLFVKYKLILIGIVIGAIGGYVYYHYIGCASGFCPITSHPINSTAYGALMGGLFFSIFKKNTDNKKHVDEEQ